VEQQATGDPASNPPAFIAFDALAGTTTAETATDSARGGGLRRRRDNAFNG